MKNLFRIFIGLCFFYVSLSGDALFAQQSDSARACFDRAMKEKSMGRHKVAYDQLRTAVQLDSSVTDYYRELGLESIELKQYEVAKQAFYKVFQRLPTDTQAIGQLGNLNLMTRRWDEAIRFGHKMEELGIGSRVNYLLGKSYYEKENFGKAFRYLDAAYKEEPANAEIPIMFARSLVDMSNYKLAVKYYGEAIALDSSRTQWIYEMAMAFSAIPDEKTAVRFYELAIEKGYKVDADVLENLANSYFDAGMPDKAIDLQLKMLEERPADLSLLYNLGDSYYRVKKYDQAIRYWDQVLAYDQEHARALFMMGMAYQKKGDQKKGRMMCDKAILMDPSLKNFRQARL